MCSACSVGFSGQPPWQKILVHGEVWKRVHCSCVNVEIVQTGDFDIAALKEHRDLSELHKVSWYPKWDCERRIELLGDSKVVVNWSNGIWPVKNPRMKDLVDEVRAAGGDGALSRGKSTLDGHDTSSVNSTLRRTCWSRTM